MTLSAFPALAQTISKDLKELGIHRVSDLRHQDPEHLYQALRNLKGKTIDRCVLYVFRCAVYFADHEHHDPELLKWWNWKDRP